MSKQFLTFQISNGWTGVIGANGSGKTTLLKLACGLIIKNRGSIEAPLNHYYVEQRTDEAPFNFGELLNSNDKYSFQLINSLHINHEWINRWNTLSHGERKRTQIACALFKRPDLLAIDEPTNHLDSTAKELLIRAINSFSGIGLIISHDRDLMENLCTQFLFVDPLNIDFRRGKFSETVSQRNLENESSIKKLELMQLKMNKMKKEYDRRSELVEKSKRKSSKKKIDKKDRDAKAKIDLGRLTGKDTVGGSIKTHMQKRIENLESEMNSIEIKRNYQTGIMLSDSVSTRNYLLSLEPGSIKLSENKALFYKDIVIAPADKIALIGDNGSGKSTFIRYIQKHINAGNENITYIPQEVAIAETKKLITEIKQLPRNQLGKLLTIISRLGSDAKHLLETDTPSPGETRKLLLGLGITKNPHIIIMDEPTNHMDIVSIECLKEALKHVSCALLLVSHDKRFLNTLTQKEWKISEDGTNFTLTTS